LTEKDIPEEKRENSLFATVAGRSSLSAGTVLADFRSAASVLRKINGG
jgi:hypothetical protein